MNDSLFVTFKDPDDDGQQPYDVAVMMPTILRPTLAKALHSVFEQDLPGRIQILIGIDKPSADLSIISEMCKERTRGRAVGVLYPGYSTSVRHGGLHPARDGGVLRCVLTYLANSRLVAYLDDDNWWAPDHLSRLLAAVEGKQWAYALRWFVHPESREPICIDVWESLGPGRGCFMENGGWVDPNCLLFDKLACEPAIRWWTMPLEGDRKAMSADRHVFHWLATHYAGGATGKATVFYQLDPRDSMQPLRLHWLRGAYERAG
ncbi:MAG: glycosyltransferase family 2 protein [Nitrosospira sp.]|nr:glycosyltransferase family 2 protein [Nitrosospira sp.]